MSASGYLNWFVTAYIIMYILSPFINKLLLSLSKVDFSILLIILILFFSIFKTLFNNPSIGTGGDDAIWIIIVYIMGAYLRLNIEVFKKIKFKWLISGLLVSLIVSFVSVFILDIYNKNGTVSANPRFYGKFIGGTSPLQLMSAVLIFIIFIKLKPFYNRGINYIASTTFAIYLIHANTLIVNWLWNDIVHAQLLSNSSYIFLYAIMVTIIIFVTGFLIESFRTIVFRIVNNRIINFISEFFESLYSKLNKYY